MSEQKNDNNSTATTAIIGKQEPITVLLTTPKPKPLPLFKPIPPSKTYTRINSKITNLTVSPEFLLPKPIQNVSKTISTIKTTSRLPIKLSTIVTVKPIEIKTILEAEPLEHNVEPTLPPSLPNLKIIPFLPTDAVKADRNKPVYDTYESKAANAKHDYELYEDAKLYPSITERYPTYADVDDGSEAEYIYKFNIEGPPVSTMMGASNLQIKGFSPPTKTEGGFVPKQPLILDAEAQNVALVLRNDYQSIKYIDITTADPVIENTTKLIEITTPDPFKDVIRTEPSPDLASLIEDQQLVLSKKNNLTTGKKNNNHNARFNVSSEKDSLDTYSHLLHKKLVSVLNTTDKLILATTVVPPFKSLPHVKTKIISTIRPTLRVQTEFSQKPSKYKVEPTIYVPETKVNMSAKTTIGLSAKPTTTVRTTTSLKSTIPIVSKLPSTSKKTINPVFTMGEVTPFSSTSNLMAPFDKLPIVDTSFEVQPISIKTGLQPNVDSLLSLAKNKNLTNRYENYEPLTLTSTSTSAPSTTIATSFSHIATNSLLDALGSLKLAGCNIYGRMYRVDRIIVELSNKCRECKCTEVGVECTHLDC